METTIGIDLGTTFSAVATVDEYGKPYLVKNTLGDTLTPSVLFFEEGNELVGTEAKEMQALGEENVASFFKRNMGDPNFFLDLAGEAYSAERLSGLLLQHLKAGAEQALGTAIGKAVITVPAYFNNLQREATVRAGEAAGLEVLRIINEPTAAALAYGLNRQQNQTLLVYDLGGGTFDVTLIRYGDQETVVLATDGDHELGGKNWDDRIVNYLAFQFEEEFGENPLDDTQGLNDVLVQAELAKRQLSTREQTQLTLVHAGNRGRYALTRAEFEEMTRDLLERTQLLTESVLAEQNLTWEALDGVLLVGGSTRMPQVGTWVTQMSGKPVLRGINVDEAVAMGAALAAHQEVQADTPTLALASAPHFTDVMSHSLGIVAENQDRSRYINSIIIPKNNTIPSTEKSPFQVATRPGQESELAVFMVQGESSRPLDNQIIGKYTISGVLHEGRKNKAVVEVTYQYDKNGIIAVSAEQPREKKTLPVLREAVPDDLAWMDTAPKDRVEPVMEHLSVLFTIDLSGSMSGQPLAEAQRAALGFISELDLTHTSVGLLSFADWISETVALCQNKKKLKKGVDSWTIGEVGYGNNEQPFSRAKELLTKRKGHRFVVVLTDGVWYDQPHAIREAKACHAEDIGVIAIGFGGADEGFLRQIASAEEDALFVDLGGLVEQLSNIGQVLTSAGGSPGTGLMAKFR